VDSRVIQVPLALLQDQSHTPHVKLVWMARRLEPEASPARVEALTGLSRHTVLSGLAELPGIRPPRGGPKAQIPAGLLAERGVGARAKVLYGLLQSVPTFCGQRGRFTYPGLSTLTKLGPNTLKRAVTELRECNWVRTDQKSRLQPIFFRLGTPVNRQREREALLAERRLKRAEHRGEALMHEYLSLLIDSTDFVDTTRHNFLVSPLTQERLELDRFYRTARVAFEYQGEQHTRASARFTQKEVDELRLRDTLKAGLCLRAGVHLVLVEEQDLSLQAMERKIGTCMPRRSLDGQDRLIEMLEVESLIYVAKAKAARAAEG